MRILIHICGFIVGCIVGRIIYVIIENRKNKNLSKNYLQIKVNMI